MYCFTRSVFVGGLSLLGLALIGGCSVSGSNVSFNPDVMDSDGAVMKHGTGALNIDWNDEIIKGSAVTKDGAVVQR